MIKFLKNKIILPSELSPDRNKLISNFLNNWLNEKQLKGMETWFTEMLNQFMNEVLICAQNVGIDKLLLQPSMLDSMLKELRNREKISLPLVKPKPKLSISKIKLEEVEGDLASETKSVLVSSIKTP